MLRAACTIVARNYRAQARVLARSFLALHPGARFFALVVDLEDDDRKDEPFEVVRLTDLGLAPAELRALLFRYSVIELCTAVKPLLLSALLVHHGLERLLYLDPDILVLASLEPVFDALATSSIALVPHITRPLPEDGQSPDELTFLLTGTYNLGFIGVARSPAADELLAWWWDRLRERCVVRPEVGLFVDQRWVDLVPGLFPGTTVLRDPGLDVAYWNLHERRVTLAPEPRVNGSPLRFFHFSGFDPRRPEVVSSHQTRFQMQGVGEARDLFQRYAELLVAAGFLEEVRLEYRWGRFDDGTPIAPLMRELHRRLGAEARAALGDPFASGPGSLLEHLHAPAPGEPTTPPYVSNLLAFVWREPELLLRDAEVPRFGPDQREELLGWARGEGHLALGLDQTGRARLREQTGSGALEPLRAGVGRLLSSEGCRVCALKALLGAELTSAVRGPGVLLARGDGEGGGPARRRWVAPVIEALLRPCARHTALRRAIGR